MAVGGSAIHSLPDTGDGSAEDRLEAALERIARAMDTAGAPAIVDPRVDEVQARLDQVIETLRAALGK